MAYRRVGDARTPPASREKASPGEKSPSKLGVTSVALGLAVIER
jgi:hypothetical protein